MYLTNFFSEDKTFIVKGKKIGDGFREVVQVEKNKSTVLHTEKQTGNKKNGTYIKKNINGLGNFDCLVVCGQFFLAERGAY